MFKIYYSTNPICPNLESNFNPIKPFNRSKYQTIKKLKLKYREYILISKYYHSGIDIIEVSMVMNNN